MQDSAAPWVFRMVLAHPERIEALIVQNAVAHNEGLERFGKHAGPFGLIAPPTRVRFAQTSCHSRLRGRAT